MGSWIRRRFDVYELCQAPPAIALRDELVRGEGALGTDGTRQGNREGPLLAASPNGKDLRGQSGTEPPHEGALQGARPRPWSQLTTMLLRVWPPMLPGRPSKPWYPNGTRATVTSAPARCASAATP